MEHPRERAQGTEIPKPGVSLCRMGKGLKQAQGQVLHSQGLSGSRRQRQCVRGRRPPRGQRSSILTVAMPQRRTSLSGAQLSGQGLEASVPDGWASREGKARLSPPPTLCSRGLESPQGWAWVASRRWGNVEGALTFPSFSPLYSSKEVHAQEGHPAR